MQIDPTLHPSSLGNRCFPRMSSLTFPKLTRDLDLYFLVFDGEVSIKGEDIAGKQKRLWRWNAGRVPGLGAMIECKEPTRAILVLVANTPGGSLGPGRCARAEGRLDQTTRPGHFCRDRPAAGPGLGRRGLPHTRVLALRGRQRQPRVPRGIEERANSAAYARARVGGPCHLVW